MKQSGTPQTAIARPAAKRLADALVAMRDADECLALIQDLCTPAELEAIVDRWRVAEQLDAGRHYREIHDRTGVSVTTVGRVARFMGQGHGGYRLALDRTRDARR